MRATIVALVALAGLLGLAPAAYAKGPTAVVIEGPGLSEPLRVETYEASGPLPGIDVLMNHTGASVMFGSGTTLEEDAPAELGSRFAVTYLMGTDVVLTQELYPFATGGPYTFTPPGQRSVFVDAELASGWFRGPESLTTTLVGLGATESATEGATEGATDAGPVGANPEAAPEAAPVTTAAAAGTGTGWWLGGSLAAAALVLAAGLALLRRGRGRAAG